MRLISLTPLQFKETKQNVEQDEVSRQICGRSTMEQHFAEKKPFMSAPKKPAGPRPVFLTRRAQSCGICVDTLGEHLITAAGGAA